MGMDKKNDPPHAQSGDIRAGVRPDGLVIVKGCAENDALPPVFPIEDLPDLIAVLQSVHDQMVGKTEQTAGEYLIGFLAASWTMRQHARVALQKGEHQNPLGLNAVNEMAAEITAAHPAEVLALARFCRRQYMRSIGHSPREKPISWE